MHIATANPLILTNSSRGEVDLFSPLFFLLPLSRTVRLLSDENRLLVTVRFCHLTSYPLCKFVFLAALSSRMRVNVDMNRRSCPDSGSPAVITSAGEPVLQWRLAFPPGKGAQQPSSIPSGRSASSLSIPLNFTWNELVSHLPPLP